MSNRGSNTHRRAIRTVTPVVRIGRNAAGAAITAGLLVGGASGALADGGVDQAAGAPGAVATTAKAAPAVALPASTAGGYGYASAAFTAKKKPVVTPAPAVERENADENEDSSSSTRERTNRTADRDQADEQTTAQQNADEQDSADSEKKAAATKDEAPAEQSSAKGGSIVETARNGIGVRYVYGGSTRGGWDCSGFTAWVYAQHGVSLPHSASGQKSQGTVISKSEARPGDLVYTPGHIGIYAGNNTIIDAGTSVKDTSERKMWSASWTFVRVG